MTRILINKALLLAGVFVFVFSFGCRTQSPQHAVCVRDVCYRVEVASTDEQWAAGLMHREHLDEERGMLFIFPRRFKHSFWMKNTLIPLDIIWLDHARRVVDFKENAPPCEKKPCPSYPPEAPALYVLELNAGQAQKLGLKKGDQFTFKLQLDQL